MDKHWKWSHMGICCSNVSNNYCKIFVLYILVLYICRHFWYVRRLILYFWYCHFTLCTRAEKISYQYRKLLKWKWSSEIWMLALMQNFNVSRKFQITLHLIVLKLCIYNCSLMLFIHLLNGVSLQRCCQLSCTIWWLSWHLVGVQGLKCYG